jgi:hypothetical protein
VRDLDRVQCNGAVLIKTGSSVNSNWLGPD